MSAERGESKWEIERTSIEAVAKLLHESGYATKRAPGEPAGYNTALDLVQDEIVRLAKQKGISLLDALTLYANCDDDRDTSWCELGETIRDMGNIKWRELTRIPNIKRKFTKQEVENPVELSAQKPNTLSADSTQKIKKGKQGPKLSPSN